MRLTQPKFTAHHNRWWMSRLEPNVNIADAIRKCLVSIEQATGIKVQTDLDRASMP